MCDVDHRRPTVELFGREGAAWTTDGSGVSTNGAYYPIDPPAPAVGLLSREQGVASLNAGYVYWLSYDSLFCMPQGADHGTARAISAVPPQIIEQNEPWPQIIGFVGDEVYVGAGSVVLVCDRTHVLRRIDAGEEFKHSRVSLQYVFAPR